MSPLVIAHRGDSAHATQNTLEAFDLAIAAGADMIEFDLRRTGDGDLIAFHDPRVGLRLISMISTRRVAQLAGFAPPLLDELLDHLAGRVKLDVELKEARDVQRIVTAVRERFDAEDVIFTSFVEKVTGEVRRTWPEARSGPILARRHVRDARETREKLGRLGARVVALDHRLAARDGLDWAEGLEDLRIVLWTVNEPADQRRWLADGRVYGVCGDDPGALVRQRAGVC